MSATGGEAQKRLGNDRRKWCGMTKVRHLLEISQSKRNKAYCLLRDAPFMLDAEDRAHLVQCAKFFEEEAANLEKHAGDINADAQESDTPPRQSRDWKAA